MLASDAGRPVALHSPDREGVGEALVDPVRRTVVAGRWRGMTVGSRSGRRGRSLQELGVEVVVVRVEDLRR
jgi:hypothetical protein